MADPLDTAGAPSWWFDEFTATDSEFLLRADSIAELGTGLHHLAVMADRYVVEHDQRTATEVADASHSSEAVAPDMKDRVARQLGDFTDAYKQRIQSHLDQLDPEAVAAQVSDPFQWVAAAFGRIRVSVDDAQSALTGIPQDDAALASYMIQYSQAAERRPLLPTLLRALLIAAVASAETTLIAVLRRMQFERGGLERWGSLWNAPRLHKEIRRLTRGGIEDWVPTVRADLGLDLPAASCDWDAVREVWARRHVLVHNRGLADEKYVARVPGALVGTLLEVDSEYLGTAIDLLCGLVLGVILTAWASRPKRDAFVVHYAAMNAVVAESEHRWPLAENLYALAARVDSDAERAAESQVNAWLARVHWRGPGSVLRDVEQWCTDELPRQFTLARRVLLREYAAAIAMVPELVASGEITRDELLRWPLFAALRGMPDFERAVSGLGTDSRLQSARASAVERTIEQRGCRSNFPATWAPHCDEAWRARWPRSVPSRVTPR